MCVSARRTRSTKKKQSSIPKALFMDNEDEEEEFLCQPRRKRGRPAAAGETPARESSDAEEEDAGSSEDLDEPEPSKSADGGSRRSKRIAGKESAGDQHASKPWRRKSFRLFGGNSGTESVKLTPLVQVKETTDHSGSQTLVLSLGSLSASLDPESDKRNAETGQTPKGRGRKKATRPKVGSSETAVAVKSLDMDDVGDHSVVGTVVETTEDGSTYYTVTMEDQEGEKAAEHALAGGSADLPQAAQDEGESAKATEDAGQKQDGSQNTTARKSAAEGKEITEANVRFTLMDENDMYVCDNCNMKFKEFSDLEEHEKSHMVQTATPPRRKRKRKFETGPLLTGEEKQNEDGLWECTKCGKAFEKLPYLERHMRGHTDVFKCSLCDKRFARNESLIRHRCAGDPSTQQTPQKRHFCEFCGAGFDKEAYLFRHMATHTDDFKCKFCNKRFGSNNALRQHMVKCKPDIISDAKYAEKLFPCGKCHRVFTRKATLVSHMNLHTGQFQCEKCKKCFSTPFTCQRHVAEGKCLGEEEGDAQGRFSCSMCDKSYTHHWQLNLHIARDHSEGVLCCNMCTKSFVKKEALLKHMIKCATMLQPGSDSVAIQCLFCDEEFLEPVKFRAHFMEHTHPFKCDECKKLFLRQTGLDNHQCKGASDAPGACPICKKVIRTASYMAKHIHLAHGPEQQCEVCEKTFKRTDHFLNHKCVNKEGVVVREKVRRTREQREAEGLRDDNVCPVCGKTFNVVSNLTKHMKSHGQREVPCPQCDKLFYTQAAVKQHLKHVHADTTHACQFCGKEMKCKNSLYGHIAQYHQNTLTLYQCDVCGKQFRQKGNVKKHQLIHSLKKKYKCKFCEKTFKFPEQHRRHELWHAGPKHQCNFCHTKFVMPFELKKHLRLYHSGLVYACKYCSLECRYLHTMKRHLERKHNDQKEWKSNPIQFIKGLLSKEGDPAHALLPTLSPSTSQTQYQLRPATTQDPNYIIVEKETEEGDVEAVTVKPEDVSTETRFIITNTDGQTTVAQLPAEMATVASNDIEVAQVGENFQIDASTVDSILAGFGTGNTSGSATVDHPFIVAEVQGLDAGGDARATQTIIIQTDGGNAQELHGLEVSADNAQEVAAALQKLGSVEVTVPTDEQVAETTEHVTAQEAEESVTIIGDITQSDGQSVPIALQGGNVTEGDGYIIVPMKQVKEPSNVNIVSVTKS